MSEYKFDVKITCPYCDKDLSNGGFFPPDCDCEEYKKLKEKRLEEYKNSPNYNPVLSEEEYEEKYPLLYKRKLDSYMKNGKQCKVGLEARNYDGKTGFTIWSENIFLNNDEDECFGDEDFGHCFDFNLEEAKQLKIMLDEYFELNKEK